MTNSIRVLVNGAHGRMGQAAVKALADYPGLILAGTATRGDDLTLAIATSQAQVVVELTNADAVFVNSQRIIAAGAHPVIGASGLTQAQITTLQAACAAQKLGGIIAANFSLGAVLLMKYAREIARYYQHAEIIEMHHAGKLDSPSGTALHTAAMMADQLQTANGEEQQPTRETIPGARGASLAGIPIHSIRLPGLVAYQQVIFGGTGETLTLQHNSIDRVSFMPGICLACTKVVALDVLVNGLEHIL